MQSRWVEDLFAMANAVLVMENEGRSKGSPCRFCREADGMHARRCPVSVADRVIRQSHSPEMHRH